MALIAIVTALLLLVASVAAARPGGGQRYRSGGSNFSGGSSYSPPPPPPAYSPPPPPPPSWNSRPSYSPPPPSWGSSSNDDGYGTSAPTFPRTSSNTPSSNDGPSYASRSASASLSLLLVVGLIVLFIVARTFMRHFETRRQWETSLVSYDLSEASADGSWAQYSQPQPQANRSGRDEISPHECRKKLAALRDVDPEFSHVLFLDFLYALYAAYHEARGQQGTRYNLSPYLDPKLLRTVQGSTIARVEKIVIGACTPIGYKETTHRGQTWAWLQVAFDANLTEINSSAREQRWFRYDIWTLKRRKDVRSRPPERLKVTDCPNCGGSLNDAGSGNVCRYCHETLTPGQFDWAVANINATKKRQSPDLGGDAPELGTHLPTVVAPGAKERYRTLTLRDKDFSWPLFQARVAVIFAAFHDAWTSRDLLKARPYLSDSLFQMQQYWIECYRQQALINRTDGARILETAIADATSDKHFDAITVRVFATGLDYTETEDGKLVGGSRKRERKYSEYWTLVRGSTVTGDTTVTDTCPSCGADLDIGMSGNCNHCSAHLTSGEFDWVLSRIEQDEVYG